METARNRKIISIPEKLGTWLTLITTIMSLLAPVTYLAFFGATVEKRISLIEQNEIEFQSDMADLKSAINRANDRYENENNLIQADTRKELAQINNRIEKVYQILLESKLRSRTPYA